MTVSRAEGARIAIGLGLIGALLGTVAVAQDTGSRGPLNIIPNSRAAGATATPRRQPVETIARQPATTIQQSRPTAVPQGTEPRIAAIEPRARMPEKIEVGALGSLNGASAGLLENPSDGIGSDLWRGAVAPRIVDLLDRLRPHATSRRINALAGRLLLSGGQPPAGAGDDFAIARVRALQRFGRAGAAARLASAVAGKNADLMRLSADAALSDGNPEAACTTAFDDGRTGDAFWNRLRAYCEARSGNESAALLEADLLRESGNDDDELFHALLDRTLFGIDVDMPAIGDATPVQFAMMTQGGDLPDIRKGVVPAPYLRALQSRASDPVDRAVLGLRGWTLAVIDAGTLAKTLTDVPPAARGPLARTYADYAAAADQGRVVDGLARLWAYGGARKRFALVTALGGKQIPSVLPAPGFERARPGFVQALLWQGDIDGAIGWYELPVAVPSGDPETEAALTALIMLADPGAPARLDGNGRAVLRGTGARGGLLLALSDATIANWPPPETDRRAADLVKAVNAGRKGEALLAALILMTERDDVRSSVLAVRAIRQAGLVNEARDISIDLALQQPWPAGR